MTEQRYLLDLVVTRKESDPTDYRKYADHPLCRLIEVPFVPEGMTKCRRDLAAHGDSPFVAWFDPDDHLYRSTIPTLIEYIQKYPNIDAVLMLSDIYHPLSSQKSVDINKFADHPVNNHLMRAVNRKWLNAHLDDFNHSIAEWVFLARLVAKSNAIILPQSAYRWISTRGGAHMLHSKSEVDATRDEVRRIMGYKYDYQARMKRPHGH